MAPRLWSDVFAFHRFWSVFLGALLVLSWSYYNVLCSLTKVFNNAFVLLACIVVNSFVVPPLLCFTWKSVHLRSWREWTSILCFGTFDALLIALMSFAFQHIPIGDASCLFAMRVVWTPMLEAAWQRRCVPWGQVAVMVLSMIGAVLITQPAVFFGTHPTSPSTGAAYICAFVAGLIAGFQFLFLALCPHVHWSVWQAMIVPMGWVVAPINYLLVNGVSFPTRFQAQDVAALLLIAAFDLLGRACRTGAVQEHRASTVALISVLEIPFTYFWGFVYLGQELDGLEIAGAVCIMASVVILSIPCLWGEGEEEEERHLLAEKSAAAEDTKSEGSYLEKVLKEQETQ